MAALLVYTSLVMLTLTFTVAYDDNDMKRTLEELERLTATNNKRGFSCRKMDEACRGVPACCGDMKCYWPDGYSPFRAGACVNCVAEGNKCQRDAQCCPDLMCDKGNALWIDGRCSKYRREGACYRKGQCVTECSKKWFQVKGTCS